MPMSYVCGGVAVAFEPIVLGDIPSNRSLVLRE
jgi:hypothetical protein